MEGLLSLLTANVGRVKKDKRSVNVEPIASDSSAYHLSIHQGGHSVGSFCVVDLSKSCQSQGESQLATESAPLRKIGENIQKGQGKWARVEWAQGYGRVRRRYDQSTRMVRKQLLSQAKAREAICTLSTACEDSQEEVLKAQGEQGEAEEALLSHFATLSRGVSPEQFSRWEAELQGGLTEGSKDTSRLWDLCAKKTKDEERVDELSAMAEDLLADREEVERMQDELRAEREELLQQKEAHCEEVIKLSGMLEASLKRGADQLASHEEKYNELKATVLRQAEERHAKATAECEAVHAKHFNWMAQQAGRSGWSMCSGTPLASPMASPTPLAKLPPFEPKIQPFMEGPGVYNEEVINPPDQSYLTPIFPTQGLNSPSSPLERDRQPHVPLLS